MKTGKPKPIERVYVVHKRSVYQKFILDLGNSTLSKLIKQNHPATKTMFYTYEQHRKSLQLVRDVLNHYKIKYNISSRSISKNFSGYDLVITVGGDGTFLRTSHYVDDQLILGVNSVPKLSVGALCSITYDDFPRKFKDILAGKYRIKELHRMALALNNHPLPIEPINDILFTNYSPAATSRYIIQYNNKKEEHKSSGIWICTPHGSTAAMQAAGGKKQKRNENRLQFLAREAYQGKNDKPYHIVHGFLGGQQKLKIMSKMLKSRVYLDGPSAYYTLDFGDELTVGLSRNTLKVIR